MIPFNDLFLIWSQRKPSFELMKIYTFLFSMKYLFYKFESNIFKLFMSWWSKNIFFLHIFTLADLSNNTKTEKQLVWDLERLNSSWISNSRQQISMIQLYLENHICFSNWFQIAFNVRLPTFSGVTAVKTPNLTTIYLTCKEGRKAGILKNTFWLIFFVLMTWLIYDLKIVISDHEVQCQTKRRLWWNLWRIHGLTIITPSFFPNKIKYFFDSNFCELDGICESRILVEWTRFAKNKKVMLFLPEKKPHFLL